MTDARQTGSPQSRHYVLFILFLAYVTAYLDRQLLAMLLPQIKEDMHLSDTALGLLTGPAFAAFYITLGFPIARIADKRSRRVVLSISIAIWSVMTMATSMARSLTTLALCRVGVGIGEAGCTPPAHSLIADLYKPEERGTAIAIYSLGISVGIVIAFAMGGWLGDAVGWRTSFQIVGLPGIVIALLIYFTVKEPARQQVADAQAPGLMQTWRHLFALPSFRHLLLAGAITNLAFTGGLQWLPSFFVRSHDMRMTEIGLWLAATAGIVGGLGTFLGGWLGDRLGRRDKRWYMWVPAIGMMFASPTLVLLFTLDDGRNALMLYAIPAFGAALGVAPIYAMGQGLAKPSMRAVTAATILFCINLIGLGVGPQLVGFLSDAFAPRYGQDALRHALMIALGIGSFLPILHYLLGARTLRADLETAAR